jgi:hypothetical protein
VLASILGAIKKEMGVGNAKEVEEKRKVGEPKREKKEEGKQEVRIIGMIGSVEWKRQQKRKERQYWEEVRRIEERRKLEEAMKAEERRKTEKVRRVEEVKIMEERKRKQEE